SSSLMREMGVPSITISPALGTSSPPIRWSRVLFPEPLGPMIDTNSPAAMSSDTPARARTSVSPWRKTLWTSRTEIIARDRVPQLLPACQALSRVLRNRPLLTRLLGGHPRGCDPVAPYHAHEPGASGLVGRLLGKEQRAEHRQHQQREHGRRDQA